MPQFVVTARDGGDAAARPVHLRNIAPMVADGRIVLGGALLDDAGSMIGSVLVVAFFRPCRARCLAGGGALRRAGRVVGNHGRTVPGHGDGQDMRLRRNC